MVRAKVRIRFRKAGDLRLVSHHDLMRTFERMLRRASVPFHSTSGFNPKPRLVFALSLGLGLVGSDEVAELELDEEVAPDDLHRRLTRQAPPGLEILDVRGIDARVTARVDWVRYRVPVPAERGDELPEKINALLARTECWVERTRPQPRRFNLRPYLKDLGARPGAVEMEIWVTPNGTTRPDEVLEQLGLSNLLAQGAVIERTAVRLNDELETAPVACGLAPNAKPHAI